jgi:bifunctional UDP-N-acetylglucosamine pyrophosphorylase / glucosamine-1-phosphate N-acetyltransferase
VTAPVVVILAAGQGTRMRSAVQKLLHPLCGRPIIEWPVAAARAAGAAKIVVVDGPDRRLAAALNGAVSLAVQERPLGTADAVRAAIDQISGGDTVVVVNGDAPLVTSESLRALVAAHEGSGAAATIATMVLADPSGYGRVVRAADGTVERVVETKAAGDATEADLRIREVNTGMFAFDGAALAGALEEVRADNAQGEHYLPDVLAIMRAHARTVGAYELADPDEMLGINDRVQLAEVAAVAQRQIHERHMIAGVTIVNPAATVIDADVAIGPDTVIAPFTSLHGATAIGSGSTIGPNSTLIDASVGDGSKVLHAYVTGAVIGDRVSVGPFAYLRPGTVLREGSKAGTFVEIKNSDIGAGAKVPHLSYIGDTDIGERTNIGAGTITANYDGKNKNRTTIGAGAFVSVDTMFVAPVSLGDGAYTAAGSVITHDVPPGALGVARARQRNIDGYGDRRKERDAAEHDASDGANNVPPSPETEPAASKSSGGEPAGA